MGGTASTIDLNRIDLGPEALARAEAAANEIIDRALPVTPAFVSQADLAHIPLRKPPKVSEDIRVVQVAGFDWSACGGTHVADTARIGLIKVVATERRGPETRITFLCGRRAAPIMPGCKRWRRVWWRASPRHKTICWTPSTAGAAEMQALRKDLSDLEGQWVESTAAALSAAAEVRGTLRVVALAVDYAFERAKRVAQAVRGRPGTVVVLGVRGERPQILCARADDVTLNAGELLRTAVTAGGGRGGGRPDWAQGGVPTNDGLTAALAAAVTELSKLG